MLKVIESYQKLIKDVAKEAVEWRRHLHSHPELAFEEQETSQFIQNILKDLDIPFESGIAKTGVIGKLEVEVPVRKIGLRVEMDALPIREENDFSYKSIYPNRMHACGHDGHMASLLGTAKVLSILKKENRIPNSIYFIFQPAEENEGGAKKIVEEHFLKLQHLNAIYALHNWPEMELNKFGLKKGFIMSAYDSFNVTFEGKGSHAAMPHLGNDLVFIASFFIQNIYASLSRMDPVKNKLLSFTSFHAGSTYNVLPDKVELKGTIRTFDEKSREEIIYLLQDYSHHISQLYNIKVNFHLKEGYPATENDSREIEYLERIIKENFGDDRISYLEEPSMGSEDFSYFLKKIPGAYIWIGSEKKNNCYLHSPKYDFNDQIIETIIRFWIAVSLYKDW